jgi:hypothetical protein
MAATLLLVEQLPANGAEPARPLANQIRGHAGQDDTQPGGGAAGRLQRRHHGEIAASCRLSAMMASVIAACSA